MHKQQLRAKYSLEALCSIRKSIAFRITFYRKKPTYLSTLMFVMLAGFLKTEHCADGEWLDVATLNVPSHREKAVYKCAGGDENEAPT